jgi:DNA mismatch endonuclease (patch repair protein)
MTDVLTPSQRKFNMSRIRGRGTLPEMRVRLLIRRMGYRFRVYDIRLPGKPDLVIPSLSIAVFVHGCFWHMHRCRWGKVTPATNSEFWASKRQGNVDRDRNVAAQFHRTRWKRIVVWECWTEEKLEMFLHCKFKQSELKIRR